MNIFVTYPDPTQCACALDDKRVVKMVLQTAQLLSTALLCHGHPDQRPLFREAHANHPCSLWVRETRSNYIWTFRHFSALCKEYMRRFNRQHLSERKLASILDDRRYLVPDGEQTPFVNCTNFRFLDVHNAYREQLVSKWKTDIREPKWTNAQPPAWAVGSGLNTVSVTFG